MTPARPRAVLATLCYLRTEGKTLMLHRNKKPGDVHRGKWNGLGGKFDPGESPDDCVKREMKEESGLIVSDARLRGVLTFPAFKDGEDWIVFVYTATRFEGELTQGPEGHLEWVADAKILDLPLWEGDKIFLPWLDQPRFFTGKFSYQDGTLVSHDSAFH